MDRKRFLFVTLGTLGDVHPYVAIGRALTAAGHSATVATLARHEPVVRGAGLRFLPAQPDPGPDDPDDELTRVFLDPDDAPRLLTRRLVMDRLPASVAAARRAMPTHDLAILHPTAVGARLVAEKEGRPWISTVLSPATLPSRLRPPHQVLPPTLNAATPEQRSAYFGDLVRPWYEVRHRLGLPFLRATEAIGSPLGILALFDSSFAPDPGDWPAGVVTTGFCRYDGPAAVDDERVAEAFLATGAPPVIATLGAQSRLLAASFFPAIAAAARALGRRLLAIGGSAAELGLTADPDLACVRSLPFSRCFRRGAAIVAHAGIGTTARALEAGVPFLAVALPFHDGPDNARRVAATGVGLGVALSRLDAPTAMHLLGELLTQDRFVARARRLATALEPVDGAACAARHILDATRP